ARHHHWLRPHFWDDRTGDLGSRIGTYVVKTPRHTVLVDTGVGNDKPRDGSPAWHMRRGAYLDDLRAAGVAPEQVDVVLCTHLHIDHVGWNTRSVGDRWVPTFPNARYVFAGEEWEFWRHEKDACIADSVVPVVEAGQAALVDADYAVDDWLRLALVPPTARASHLKEQPKKHKVVYHLDEAGLDKARSVLGNIENHIRGVGGADHIEAIELVVHGAALRNFVTASMDVALRAALDRLQTQGLAV